MKKEIDMTNLTGTLRVLGSMAREREQVSLGFLLESTGRRSFGPVLLIAGLVILAPIIGDIPGVPTIMGLFVILVSAQLLLGRRHFRLPRWLSVRSMSSARLQKVLRFMRAPARYIDRYSRPRYTALTTGFSVHVIAATCLMIAGIMPVMELIPFSANIAGVALSAFGLSLIARDGLVATFAYLFTFGMFGTALYFIL